MIRVLVWNEFVQENREGKEPILAVHPRGIHETIAGFLKDDALSVRVATLNMPECGLSERALAETDVLIWWAHVAHDQLPDEIAQRVQRHVLSGMGFIPLHSAHLCKPLRLLLGTSCTLSWRHDDVCRVWSTCPGHPIAQGVPAHIDLGEEEMYGEFFDIPTPESQVFVSWFAGGEVFRSGCAWTRGFGRIFYFGPGHETNAAYHNPHVQRILRNAVRWAAPTARREAIDCPNVTESPESIRLGRGKA